MAASAPSRKTPSSSSTATPNPSTLFDHVAEEVFSRYGRHWKSATLRVNRIYLRNQILPWFAGRYLADITRADVRKWFGSLHATPAAANRSLPILSVIMREAENYGYRIEGSNPCTRIRRYREPRRERFLTAEEIGRLGSVLSEHATRWPLQVAVVRLLILTGCRQSEVRTLRWADYREGHLFLRDSKSGPRTVWLSSASRRVIESLHQLGDFVFPGPGGRGPMSTETLYAAWRRIRNALAMPSLRLHDLRHSYASFALQRGETVVTIGRLLGHRDPNTTLKYTHFGDDVLQEAVERVGKAVGG